MVQFVINFFANRMCVSSLPTHRGLVCCWEKCKDVGVTKDQPYQQK